MHRTEFSTFLGNLLRRMLALAASWFGVVLLAAYWPVPESVTDWGELPALSVRVKAAEAAPIAVGLNCTLMVQ